MSYLHPDTVIQIFCKAPVAGTVKTRLMKALTAEQAAEVHKTLSRETFERVGASGLCAMQIWCSPTIEDDFFSLAADDFSCDLRLQQGNDLGARMHHAICSGLEDYAHVLLMGCDCPSLTRQDLQTAIEHLSAEAEVVLAPAEDGGYVLIGLNRPNLSLFADMQWGVSSVLSVTRERVQAAQLCCYELAEQWDVDEPEDLQRYLR